MAVDQLAFHYLPLCSHPECERPARFKIAAPWSFGAGRELKNYGLTCDLHREQLLARATLRAEALAAAEGEQVGKVAVYPLLPGLRDAELNPVD